MSFHGNCSSVLFFNTDHSLGVIIINTVISQQKDLRFYTSDELRCGVCTLPVPLRVKK